MPDTTDNIKLEQADAPRSGRSLFLARLGRQAYALAGLATPLCRGWRWLPTAVIAGTAPFLISYALGQPGHQLVSAIAVGLLCLACVRTDAWLRGIAIMTVAFVAHSAVVITMARHYPEQVAPLIPGGEDYWQKQITWIETGQDPEYELSAWVPAHAQLVAATIMYSYTSWGALTFYEGLLEVDLMNFYNAQLISKSEHRPLALVCGWHIWSILRGIGFLFITFEVISLSLQHISGQKLADWSKRRFRWAMGLSFILADGVVKAILLGPVRDQLFANLQ